MGLSIVHFTAHIALFLSLLQAQQSSDGANATEVSHAN